MDYEKKYNDALKWMRELYPGLHGATKEDAEHYFPELRESEDERIRKELIQFLNEIKSISEGGRTSWAVRKEDTEMCNRFLTYLEKQKEQNGEDEECIDFTIYHPLKNGKGKYECIPYSFYGSLTSFKGGKDLIDFLRTCFYTKEECNEWIKQQEQKHPDGCFTCDEYKKGYEAGRLNGFTAGYNKAMKEQKPAWSEEDADMLNCCISSIEEAKENRYAYKETDGDTSYDREIDWLKSLRPSWKPSEEQMDRLFSIVAALRKDCCDDMADFLALLYKQLKKL